jgi:hypothetical protein
MKIKGLDGAGRISGPLDYSMVMETVRGYPNLRETSLTTGWH